MSDKGDINVPVQTRQINRRRLLAGLARGSFLAVIALITEKIVRFLSFQPSNAASTLIPVGPPKDYPPGALAYVQEARAYVGHDKEGLYALDAVCPHLGCLVEQESDGRFICPCHDSRFKVDGAVQRGPATKPLRYLDLQIDQDGQLIVNRNRSTEPATRLIV